MCCIAMRKSACGIWINENDYIFEQMPFNMEHDWIKISHRKMVCLMVNRAIFSRYFLACLPWEEYLKVKA